ncbi:MAG TPA: serine/threonine-protein kinase, partial [Gemmatimonadaceae bacterium]
MPPQTSVAVAMARYDLAHIGKYQITELIGEGAMGVVYRALDPVLTRPVAIKVMTDALAHEPEQRDRFLREAQTAGSLQHPNIVTIYDCGEVDGHPFIAMEYIEGADLATILERHEPLPLKAKLDIAIDALTGLAYAHKHGVVHRDIKPANIRITEDGRAKIMDFGIAHLSSSSMTRTGVMMGTPNYMAPEQV